MINSVIGRYPGTRIGALFHFRARLVEELLYCVADHTAQQGASFLIDFVKECN